MRRKRRSGKRYCGIDEPKTLEYARILRMLAQFVQVTFVLPLVAPGKTLSHFTTFPVVLFVISMPYVVIVASLLFPEKVFPLPDPSSV